MTETELHEAVKEASEVHEHTIVISPIQHDYAVFRGSDIGICGGYINPFPVFPWQLNARKNTFVAGYRDMQRRIRNPKILDPSRCEEVSETVMRRATDINSMEENNFMSMTVTKTVDSEETIAELINFILYDSYAKDWKHPHFAMRIDGQFVANHEAPQNQALTRKEISIAVTIVLLFMGAMLWHPVYFLTSVVLVLAVGAVWIITYLLGVDRINRDLEKNHQEEVTRTRKEGADDSSSAEDEYGGMAIDTDEEEVIEEASYSGVTGGVTVLNASTIMSDSGTAASATASATATATATAGDGWDISSSLLSSPASSSCSHRVLRSATKKQKYL